MERLTVRELHDLLEGLIESGMGSEEFRLMGNVRKGYRYDNHIYGYREERRETLSSVQWMDRRMRPADKCPMCSRNSQVNETRRNQKGQVHRRRECLGCHYRWSTIEITKTHLEAIIEGE